MNGLDFIERLLKLLRQDMNNYADDMANGGCKSYEEYRELCGVIRGLALAEDYIKTLHKEILKDDDE